MANPGSEKLPRNPNAGQVEGFSRMQPVGTICITKRPVPPAELRYATVLFRDQGAGQNEVENESAVRGSRNPRAIALGTVRRGLDATEMKVIDRRRVKRGVE